jgi:outer membrane protein OmpA-like peptidoglycan-associated protein
MAIERMLRQRSADRGWRPDDTATAPAVSVAPRADLASLMALQRTAGNRTATAFVARAQSPLPDLSAEQVGARCACGGVVTAAGGECEECRARRLGMDRHRTSHQTMTAALARCVLGRKEADEPGRCRYEPGERERSAQAPGAVDQIESGEMITAVLFEFTAGSAEVKPEHRAFIAAQIVETKLNDPRSEFEIGEFEGFTDCVDTEAKNVSIRARRAESVKLAYLDAGAAAELLGPTRPALTGDLPGDDVDAGGRARNRSVRLDLRRRPVIEEPPPRDTPQPVKTCPGCQADLDLPSQRWTLSTLTGLQIVPVGGFVRLSFLLINDASGCMYDATFKGKALGAAAEASFDLFPSFERFGSDRELRPSDWNGQADARAISLFNFEHGSIRLPNSSTSPARIDIGGVSNAGVGLEAGAWTAEGEFKVEPCARHGAGEATTTTRLVSE